MQFAGQRVSMQSLLEFWQHSFLAALLSERLARLLEYAEPEQAYLGGLLHDIGLLPLWMLVFDEQIHNRELPPDNWPDNLEIERGYFGIDHGKVGRLLAVSWNFMPSFLDVFEHHHEPARAQHDPYLVAIVSVVDQFLKANSAPAPEVTSSTDANAQPSAAPGSDQAPATPCYLSECFPSLTPDCCLEIRETLRSEFTHVLPLVQLGIAVVAPGVAPDQIPCEEKLT
jgi:HDOD domain